ncbi:MAG: RNA-binding protein [Clostridia bacterium]|nr:RNA-binding protein [Clostridia bacterium]
MENNEKLVAARIEDLFSLCEKRGMAVFSDFLDGAEQVSVQENVVFPYGYNVMIYGGFEDAEKKIIGVFPEWEEPDKTDFPICCLKIEGSFTRKLTHRDYLGTIMSLGIKPAKLGDIIVGEGFAYIFAHTDIGSYIKDNITKIGNQGVKITEITENDDIRIERKYRTFGTVCASDRLDAVTAAAVNISRSRSADMITGGLVKLNHREILKSSEKVKEGDLLSIRGSGRFLVHSFDGETRKNRMHITLKQYI